MVVNCSTSGCLRIGNRHSAEVGLNSVGDNFAHWLNEIRYLGVVILSGKKFSVNLQRTKQNYFRALHAIFGKIGLNSSPVVLCSLVKTFCVPILLYAVESVT